MTEENKETTKHYCYKCGREATYQFKNGNWCCSKNVRSCPAVRKKLSENAKQVWDKMYEAGIYLREEIPEGMFKSNSNLDIGQEGICYWCGKPASYQLKNGRWCCSKYVAQCPAVRKLNSENNKNRIKKNRVLTDELRKKFSHQPWNKGLTKKTDSRVAKSSKTLSSRYKSGDLISPLKGSHHTEEEKVRISKSMKKFMTEHPDRVPYLLNHSSKASYPERYFRLVFKNEGIPLIYHKQVGRYQLDFCNEEKMRYVEIDGESHYVDPKTMKIDKERTKSLDKLGWTCIRVRWSKYRGLSKEGRHAEVEKIKDFIGL